MADIGGTPHARILLARLDLQIDEQKLVLEQKELRLRELDEEQGNIERDIERVEALASEAQAAAAVKGTPDLVARRLSITAHEQALVVKGRRIRLLELDDEREKIAADKQAAIAHIAKLAAEVSQQETRLKESSRG